MIERFVFVVDKGKRNFLKRYFLDQVSDVICGFQEGAQKADQRTTFDRYFDSYESSYALTLAYPDDILLETARQQGIETEGREKSEIIKELFNKRGGDEYRF
jgi:hypothetical protein